MNSALLTPIHEVFASVQGEGSFVGEPQVFVRLEGCPLRCTWCDTPETWTLPGRQRAGATWSEGRTRSWCTTAEVVERIQELDPGGARPVSVTGGEPLMWPEFLLELHAALPERSLHLETAGAFPESLGRVLGCFDHISADLKLPADLDPPVPLADGTFEVAPRDEKEWSETRRAVLGLLAGREACLKLVVAGGHDPRAYEELLDDVRDLAPDLPLVYQSATAIRTVEAPEPELLERLAQMGLARGLRVRLLPQLHVLLGLR